MQDMTLVCASEIVRGGEERQDIHKEQTGDTDNVHRRKRKRKKKKEGKARETPASERPCGSERGRLSAGALTGTGGGEMAGLGGVRRQQIQ